MNGADPSIPRLTQLVGQRIEGWFAHGAGVLLAFTGRDQALKALKLVPHRARDGSAQLSVEVVESHQLHKILAVAQRQADDHAAQLAQVQRLLDPDR